MDFLRDMLVDGRRFRPLHIFDLATCKCLATLGRYLSARAARVLGARPAPPTVNTMPEQTLLACAEHGELRDRLAANLQREAADSSDASWNDLMGCIASNSELLTKAG